MRGAMQQRSSPLPGARPRSLPMVPGSRLQTSEPRGMTQRAASPGVDNGLGPGHSFSSCGRNGGQGEEERAGWLAGAGGTAVCRRRGASAGAGERMEHSCSADEIYGADVRVREDGKRR